MPFPGPFFPVPLTYAQHIPYGDSFLVLGGFEDEASPDVFYDSVYEYDPVAEDWVERPERMKDPRQQFGLVFVDREVVGC